MSHRLHPDPVHDDPPDAVLFDGCQRCAEHSDHPALTLDDDRLRALMQRAYGVERDDSDHYRTRAEKVAATSLWEATLGINRVTSIPLRALLAVANVVDGSANLTAHLGTGAS